MKAQQEAIIEATQSTNQTKMKVKNRIIVEVSERWNRFLTQP